MESETESALLDVSIVLVSWNTRQLLLDCLASLKEAADGVSYDVWVVDNGSEDGTVEAIRQRFPQVRLLVNERNIGFAAANNQAIAASAGRYVFLLNSDTLARSGSIRQLVRFADATPTAAAVGPMLLNPDETFQPSFADFPSLWNEFLCVTGIGKRLMGPGYPGYGESYALMPRPVDYVAGAAMLVRRAVIERIGLMDESYFMYSEETDWCLRMHRAGWEIWFTPRPRILHYGGQSTRRIRFAMLQSLYRSKIRFFRKNYGRLPAVLLQAQFWTALRLKWLADRLRAVRTPDVAIDPIIRWSDLNGAR